MGRPRKNPLTIEKKCPTCNKTFIVSSRKYRQIFCSKSCAQHNPDVLTKMKNSQQKVYDEKYGGLHPMQTQNVIQNFKKSLFTKYGDNFYSSYLKEKTKKTKKEKYGDENYNNIEKNKNTCLERYGVDNVLKSKNIINKRINSTMEKHFNFILDFCKQSNIEFLCNQINYNGYHFSKIYKFKCLTCNYIFENTIYNLNHLFCEKCYPNRKYTLENEIFEFLTSILGNGVIINRRDRTLLNGKELDFYIPDKNIAIELNGLYWHSEIGGGIKKLYHLYKTKSCIFHGVKLIHIFETEWNTKKEIVKSILKNLLKITDKRIYARECKLSEITSTNEKNTFLQKNHLQGSDSSTIKLGLYHDSELVSIMTFQKRARFDKNIEWELMRYCNKINTSIIGAASKLFSYFINNYNPNSIVSYSDRRYFDGNIYQTLGFSFSNFTSPSYYYILNKYKTLANRMQFQKHKLKDLLENFNPEMTEWENMKNHGFDRIWDCGHSKWILKTKHDI